MLSGIIAAALYASGFIRSAGVLFPAVLGFAIIKSAFKNEQAVGKAYCSGAMIGLAGLAWIYSLILLPFLLLYMSGPVQARSSKMVMAMLLGVATPFWVYLPYYLFINLKSLL